MIKKELSRCDSSFLSFIRFVGAVPKPFQPVGCRPTEGDGCWKGQQMMGGPLSAFYPPITTMVWDDEVRFRASSDIFYSIAWGQFP